MFGFIKRQIKKAINFIKKTFSSGGFSKVIKKDYEQKNYHTIHLEPEISVYKEKLYNTH